MRLSGKKVAVLGILTALALVTFVIEGLMPSIAVPGAKIGLSNVFTLLALVLLDPLSALILVVARTVLGSLILGNMASLLYSLTAGAVSLAVTALLYRLFFPKISLLSLSVVGAVIHNLTQNLVFCLISATPQAFAYAPYLALLGVLSGATVGVIIYLLINKLPLSVYRRLLDGAVSNEPNKEELSGNEKR